MYVGAEDKSPWSRNLDRPDTFCIEHAGLRLQRNLEHGRADRVHPTSILFIAVAGVHITPGNSVLGSRSWSGKWQSRAAGAGHWGVCSHGPHIPPDVELLPAKLDVGIGIADNRDSLSGYDLEFGMAILARRALSLEGTQLRSLMSPPDMVAGVALVGSPRRLRELSAKCDLKIEV